MLDSGRGELVRVGSGPVARFEGYLRGLAFHDRWAFVGLCKAREFGGLPIDAVRDLLRYAVVIIDLLAGQEVGRIEFTTGVEELFDVRVLSGITKPHLIGREDEIDEVGLRVASEVTGAGGACIAEAVSEAALQSCSSTEMLDEL